MTYDSLFNCIYVLTITFSTIFTYIQILDKNIRIVYIYISFIILKYNLYLYPSKKLQQFDREFIANLTMYVLIYHP